VERRSRGGVGLRYSIRSFLRAPGFSLALLVTMALGIGSNAAVLGFIHGLIASDEPEPSPAMTRVAFLLRAAAATVFVVACANLMSFLLARATARAKDTSVRVALGASRGQLTRQLLSESMLIAIAGGLAGLLLASWTTNIVPALFFESDAEQLVFAPDALATAATVAGGIAIAIGCGLVPIVEIRHDRPAVVLQRESLGPSRAARRLRSGLVVTQMACCCALVISAGLLQGGFRTALETGIARGLGNPVLVTVQGPLRSTRLETKADGLRYFGEVESATAADLDVSGAAWVARPPGSRPALQTLMIERPLPSHAPMQEAVLDVAVFTPRLLASITLPPVEGRMFGGGDTPDACKVVIVNTEAAVEIFEGEAVGRSIEDPAGQRVDVVGVVAARSDERAGTSNRPTVYYYGQQTAPPLERLGPAPFRIAKHRPRTRAVFDANVVSTGYFAALGLQRVAGELFSASATRDCRVAVVDQAAADLYFDGDAVGGAVIGRDGRRTTVIGVVQSAVLRHWQRPPAPAIYFPLAQDFLARMTLLLRTRETTSAVVARVRRHAAAVSGGGGDLRVTTLDDHLARTALAPERIATTLLTVAAATAFFLGLLGAYSVMAESVRQQQREIALRRALGAPRWRVLGQVVVSGLRLGMAGAGLGLFGAVLLAPWLTFSARENAADIWTWLSGPVALVAVVTLASVLPARRALSTDPIIILREN
jgi:hypothetical protein